MSFGLPIQNGEVAEYNGWTFSEQIETTGFSAKPQFDVAGRTVAYMVYTIQIHDIIQSDYPTTVDNQVASARTLLEAPAGAFKYVNKGFGNFQINVPGNPVRDVVWGPKTEVRFALKADAYAYDVFFTINVAIPECSNASFENVPLSINYKVDYDLDKSAYTTRSISGYIQIAQTRQSQASKILRWSADAYRAQIYPVPLQGFRRVKDRFGLDESKCRLDFSITDEEMGPNIPPATVIEAKASHRLTNLKPMWFQQYMGTVEATYELEKGTSPATALPLFTAFVKSRVRAPTGGSIIPINCSSFEPDAYGKPVAQFSLTYRLSLPLKQLLAINGLWTPAPDSNWNTWSGSLKNSVFNPRGTAQLSFNVNDDSLVDACGPATSMLRSGNAVQAPSVLRSVVASDFPAPAPSASWLAYRNDVFFENLSQDVLHQPLPTAAVVYGPPQNTFIPNQFVATGGYQPPTPQNAPPALLQRRGAQSYVVVMKGYAARAAYEIQAPALVEIGGVPAIEMNRQGNGFNQTTVGDVGYAVYFAQWALRYVLLTPPIEPVVPPPNPMFADTLASNSTLSGTAYPVAG